MRLKQGALEDAVQKRELERQYESHRPFVIAGGDADDGSDGCGDEEEEMQDPPYKEPS